MSTQLLFYERVTPVSKQAHGDLCVDGGSQRYEFARRVNSVPLTAIEIPAATRDYTIVFAGNEESVVPVVILGIEGNENLYLNDDGGWDAGKMFKRVGSIPIIKLREYRNKGINLLSPEFEKERARFFNDIDNAKTRPGPGRI